MESLNSSYRPFKTSNASVRSLDGDCDYYRIRVNPTFKSSGSDTSAVYDLKHVFPNNRFNLSDGEWYVYLEEFSLRGWSQWGRQPYRGNGLPDLDTTSHGIRVCLPDLIKPSKDFVMTSSGIKSDDTVAFVEKTVVPNTQSFSSFPATITTNGPEVKVTFDSIIVDALTLENNISVTLLGCAPQLNRNGIVLDAGETVAQFDAQIQATMDLINVEGGTLIENIIVTEFENSFTLKGVVYLNALKDLAAEPVQVLIAVRNGVNLNETPHRQASILFEDNPYEPVYMLKQGDASSGHAINFSALCSGQLKVVLRGDDHLQVRNVYTAPPDNEDLMGVYGIKQSYNATFVFVHKKKSMHY